MSGFGREGSGPMVGQKGIKYGLQMPSKTSEAPKRPKLGIFGDDADSQPASGDINAAIRAQQGNKRSDVKYKQMHAAALAEDANVYDYDSFHDGFQEQREKAKLEAFAKEKQGPKYIYALMSAQKNRQREQDIIYERRLARDRVEEDEVHGDKEVFVTAAYKKKLEEEKLWAAQMEAKDKEDEKRSVYKRGNMDGLINVMSAAMGSEARPSGVEEAPPVAAPAGQPAPAAAAGGGAEVKVKARANKRIEEMDKYELARFRADQRLQQRAAGGAAAGEGTAAAGGASAAGRDDARAGSEAAERADARAIEGAVEGGRGEKAGEMEERIDADKDGARGGAVKRRADAETISAAKARFLERKRARAGLS